MLFKPTVLLALLFTTATLASPTIFDTRNDVCTQCVASPNNCDITAPCSSFLNPQSGRNKLYCGCRPGYKATGVSDTDTTKQWRLNVVGHEHRVWVAPGVVCNTLCNNPFGGNPCGEVSFANQCLP